MTYTALCMSLQFCLSRHVDSTPSSPIILVFRHQICGTLVMGLSCVLSWDIKYLQCIAKFAVISKYLATSCK